MLSTASNLACLQAAVTCVMLANGAHAVPLQPGDLLAVDRDQNRLISIDAESGETTVVSRAGFVGEGLLFESPRDVVVSPEQRIFVLGKGDNPIIEVDLMSGDRSVVLGVDAGHGSDCCDLRGLALEGSRYLVSADRGKDRLRRIDLETREHALFGPYLGRDHEPVNLMSFQDESWYLSSSNPDLIRRIDSHATHNNPLVELLADSSYVGSGSTLTTPTSMAVGDADTLYSTSHGEFLYSILEFNLATGGRRLVSGSNRLDFDGWDNPNERGEGPALTDMAEIVVGIDGYLYATAPQTGLFRIDPETGDRELVTDIIGLSGLAVVPVPELPNAQLTAILLCSVAPTIRASR